MQRHLFLISCWLYSASALSNSTLPLVVTTWSADGFQESTRNAYSLIRAGASRMYSLVEGLSTCERLQCDTTVGYGGSPDESGETCLDALLIDGPGMRMGAVANLHRIKDVARVAWAVMNHTEHTMIVGESATQFAVQLGFKEEDLTTDASRKMTETWKQNNCQPNYWKDVSPDPAKHCGPYTAQSQMLHKIRHIDIHRFNHDTIGMVVVDEQGHISAGTSTNGMSHKIPGRVGDSPIPGSGAYVMDGVGGAAATGDGDVMMRFLPSYQTVEWIRQGAKPSRAARKSLLKILELYPKFQGAVVAADAKGNIGAACANLGVFKYSVGQNGVNEVRQVPCIPKIGLFDEDNGYA